MSNSHHRTRLRRGSQVREAGRDARAKQRTPSTTPLTPRAAEERASPRLGALHSRPTGPQGASAREDLGRAARLAAADAARTSLANEALHPPLPKRAQRSEPSRASGSMFARAHQAWRQHPWLRQSENIKHMFPGLGTAVVVFGTYTFLEAFYEKAFAKKAAHAPARAGAEAASH